MTESDVVIDIKTCLNTIKEGDASDDKVESTFSFTVCGVSTSVDELANGENSLNLSRDSKSSFPKSEKNTKKEKRFSMSAKKPPKPPRPPRGLSLDAADQKLIKEISELAMIKRARIERMRALKKMKAAKGSLASSSSSGNFLALLFTILFCVVILFQGSHPSRILPSNSTAVGIVRSRTSNGATEDTVVGSPSFMDLAPGLDNEDEAKKSFY